MTTWSIRTYLLALVLAASVPLLGVVLRDVRNDLEEANANSRASLRSLASAMVGATSTRIATDQAALELLGARKFSERLDPDGCQSSLEQLTLAHPEYVDAFTTDPEGQVPCSASGNRREVSAAPWFQDFLRVKSAALGRPSFDAARGRHVAVLSVPLGKSPEGFLGALHLTVDVAAFDPRIPVQLLPDSSRYGFFTDDGLLVWRNLDPEHVIGTRPNAEAARQIVTRREGEFEAVAVDGVSRLFSALPMPSTGWIAFVGMPAASVGASAVSAATGNLLATLLAITFLILIAFVVARRISEPIAELGRVARAVRHGDLSVKASAEGPRDIAEVALALNAMVLARQASEEELRAFLENSAVVAWLKDEQGRLVFASRNYLLRFGFTMEQVIGKTDAEIWPPELAERFRLSDQQLLSGGGQRETVERLTNPDGSSSSWLTNKFLFRGSDGRRLVGGLSVDITAIEHAEQARRLSDAQMDKAFGASPIGMALLSLDGHFLRVNAAFCSLLGYPEAELLKRTAASVTHPADLPRDLENVAALISGQQERYQVEKRYLHQDGHELWVQLNVSVVRDSEGKPVHCVSQVQDVTQRKAAESSARLATVGTLAAGAAHEINNPLTYVLGNLSWVEEELRALRLAVPEDRRPRLDEVIEALIEAHGGAERIAGIIAGLKSFSRKTDDAPLEPTDVVKVMESALQLTNTQRRNQAVTVSRLSPAPLVKANARQLEQVFINLLVNAAQAIPEGAAASNNITVRVHPNADGDTVVEVQDTGVGISAEVRPHLFEPFFTTKPVGAGTGLGLPTCHGIVTSFGGRIEVDSEPGKGSTFRVILPGLAGDVSTPSTPVPEPLSPLPTGHRVLVLDDDSAVARGIARSLRGGPEVVILTDPREALRQLERGEHFDLVLCDLMMPSLSGEEFHHKLLPIRPELAASMIFVTGGAFTPSATAFLATTKNECLQKPVDPNALRRLVAEQLGAAPRTS